jgi:serine/threonine protein kinase
MISSFLKQLKASNIFTLTILCTGTSKMCMLVLRQSEHHTNFDQANILIDDGCHIQLCDFGLALIGENAGMQTTSSSGKGTKSWMSPERIADSDHQLTTADDVYAFACLCYCVSDLKPTELPVAI